jgi:hypothetical protein
MSDVIIGVSSSSHNHQHDCTNGHEQVFATVLVPVQTWIEKSKNPRIEVGSVRLPPSISWLPSREKSKNRRIEESQIEVEVVTTDRRRSEFIYFSATESNLLPPPPLLVVVSLSLWANHIASKASFSSEAFTDPHINLHFAE